MNRHFIMSNSLRDFIHISNVDFSENFLEGLIDLYEMSLRPLEFPNDPANAVIKNVSFVNMSIKLENDKAKEIDSAIFSKVGVLVNEYNKKFPFMKFTKDRGYFLIKIDKGGYHRLHIDNDKGITILIRLCKGKDGQLMLLDGKFNPKLGQNQACIFPSNFTFPWSFEEVSGEPVYYLYTLLNE
jgi:hypothetical protein